MPEKSVNQMPANLKDLHDRAMAAIQKNNLDYAVTLLGSLLRQDPAYYESREALRAAQHRRAGGKTNFFRKFVGSASSLTRGQLALRTNPSEALEIAEETLNDDPTNKDAHELVAEAALLMDMPKTALLSLEIAFKANPGDRKLAEKLADTQNALGNRPRAEKILQDLLRSAPNDPVLNEKLKNVLASRTLSEGGYQTLVEGGGTYRDILRNKDEAVALEQEQRTVKGAVAAERLLADCEARLQAEPNNPRLLRQMGDLCREMSDFPRALGYYERIHQLSDAADPELARLILDTRLAMMDREFEAGAAGGEITEEQRAGHEKRRLELLMSDAQRRAELYPSDLGIRFELGELHLRAGRLGEAIAELQKAQNNPGKRIAAMSLLAQAFARRGMNDLAARKLTDALREKLVFDDEKKDLHYQLGCILDRMGRKDEAIEQFKVIYEQDIGYRDVMARVDAHYAAG